MGGMLNSSLLTDFRLTCLERNLGVHGVHVYQEGQGEVAHRSWADDRVELYSASKTVTSLAVGICQDEGRLKLTDLVLDYFPEYADIATPGSEVIRIVDLLHMRSGKDYDFFQTEDEDVLNSTDLAELFFRGDQVTPADTHFYYANACSYMLGRLVTKTSGLELREYLIPRLFDPLGIKGPWWNTCVRGHALGCAGLQLSLTEFAKLGQLLLQDGTWDGKELVSASYVEAMHTDVVPPERHFGGGEWNVGYGYQVWQNVRPGSYRADGMYGQFSVVLPDLKAVVTTLSHNEDNTGAILNAVFSDIVDKL